MSAPRTLRYEIAVASSPRAAVRLAHRIGQDFKRAGGTYYRVQEPHETLALSYAVWIELRGPKTVLDWYKPQAR